MHTVELLEEALRVAGRIGYQVRQEWLGGSGGGGCEIKGRRWMFLDVALSPADQLDLVLQTLRRHPEAATLPMPQQLHHLLQHRCSA
jgi:hypothetical protein